MALLVRTGPCLIGGLSLKKAASSRGPLFPRASAPSLSHVPSRRTLFPLGWVGLGSCTAVEFFPLLDGT